jgi:hypothetical protein
LDSYEKGQEMKKVLLVALAVILMSGLLCSCAQPPAEVPTPETTPPAETIPPAPIPPPDTTAPSAITGLIAINAYDGKINLWWDKTTAEDFDHYNIYLNKAEMANVTGMKPIQQIKDIAICRYQVTGLEDGTGYYFTVTAVDKNGNEGVQVANVSATPAPMPKGTKDPDLAVDVYQADRVWAGTTLLPLNHDPQRKRIVEVNMLGEVVWQYVVPQKDFVEAELLANNNILYTVSSKGVYEIDRSGKIVWSYLTNKIDHDADRLPNGNTIFVFGNDDQKSDPQVTEVNPKGQIVWIWYAKDHFNYAPYKDIDNEGWTHTNAVQRLSNGNTLISPRNFNLVVEVDPEGEVVRTYGEGIFAEQHDPEMLPNGNIIAANPADRPPRVVEFDPKTGKIVWECPIRDPEIGAARDANRLPNGNTLIAWSTEIVEVTPQGEIVWRLVLKGVTHDPYKRDGFYKADRISAQK